MDARNTAHVNEDSAKPLSKSAAANLQGAPNSNPARAGVFADQQTSNDPFNGELQRTFKDYLSRVIQIRWYSFLKDNLILVAIVASYVFAVYVVFWFFGIQNRMVIEFYYRQFLYISVFCTGLFSLFLILRDTFKKKDTFQRYITQNSIAGFLVVFMLAPIFTSTFASFKQAIPFVHNFVWDYNLMRLDYLLHFGHHPWKLLQPLLYYPWVINLIDCLYLLWFGFLFFFCLWMSWSRNRNLRLCFFISTLLVWILVGSCLGAVFSSAGPCYYSKVLPSSDDPFTSLMSRLDEIHKLKSLYALTNQVGLWEAKINGIWLPFGGISAMPSIHVAMATIFALLTFKVRKWLGWLAVVYVAFIQVGSVILGWHYAVDGYAAIVLAFSIWRVLERHIAPAQFPVPPK